MNHKTLELAAVFHARLIAAVPTSDPFDGADSYGQALVRMLLTLGGLVVVLLIVAKVLPRVMPNFFRKYKRAASTGIIEMLDVCPLNAQTRLYLVRVEGQRFLISVGDKGTTLVGEVRPATPPPASAEASTESFGEILRATRPVPDR